MNKSNVSNVGDLTNLAKDVEDVFASHFPRRDRPAIAICFMFGDSHEVHWVTNVSREDGITLFKETAQKMIARSN